MIPLKQPSEYERYSRHLILPEIGVRGQNRLLEGRVLLIGAGGLGSPLGLYLAAAGVGTIGLVDFDRVELSNLQRQVIHDTGAVGTSKAVSAKKRIEALNPAIHVRTHEARLSRENALEIAKDYDLIIDGTDNFPTRYLVNDVCVMLGKPNVYGSIFRFDGQASVFHYEDGPCYRCLYPDPPPPGMVPSCAEGGVIGILPGIVGLIQAMEAVKIITGIGRTLSGRLLLFDALGMNFRELQIKRNPQCSICGENPTQTDLIDYEWFCGHGGAGKSVDRPQDRVAAITAVQLARRMKESDPPILVDVRERHEYDLASIDGSVLMPLSELDTLWQDLQSFRDRDMVVHCRSGVRSARAIEFLQQKGFQQLWNLEGGILAWKKDINPELVVF